MSMPRTRRSERQISNWTRAGSIDIAGTIGEVWESGPWRVILTVDVSETGVRWQHVSLSNEDLGIWPSWRQLVAIRDRFLGPEADTIQQIPPTADWMSVRDNCFHLFAREDGSQAMCNHIGGKR